MMLIPLPGTERRRSRALLLLRLERDRSTLRKTKRPMTARTIPAPPTLRPITASFDRPPDGGDAGGTSALLLGVGTLGLGGVEGFGCGGGGGGEGELVGGGFGAVEEVGVVEDGGTGTVVVCRLVVGVLVDCV